MLYPVHVNKLLKLLSSFLLFMTKMDKISLPRNALLSHPSLELHTHI